MKTLSHNAIHRSLNLMAFQLEHQIKHLQHRHDAIKLTEVQQQYQLDFTGSVGPGSATDFTIHFHEIFYYAPLQRSNKNEDPQFWWGAVLDTGEAFFSVHVKKWILDDRGNYTGAVVRVSAMAGAYTGQGAATGSAVTGTIHCTFQGLGAPVEDSGFDETP